MSQYRFRSKHRIQLVNQSYNPQFQILCKDKKIYHSNIASPVKFSQIPTL